MSMPAPPPLPTEFVCRGAAEAGRQARLLGSLALVTLLVACASGGDRRASPARPSAVSPVWQTDGPGVAPPPDLASVPDAVPIVEPMRSGPMRPYQVLGRSYVPITEDLPHVERGLASWYGRKFHGRPTASGEPYDMYAMTAAHPTLPLPSYLRVRNPANDREVVVRVNDRGPFHGRRIIDLSYTAALKLDLLRGVMPVEIERITTKEIRSGSWRRERDAPAHLQPRPQPAPTLPPAELAPFAGGSLVALPPAPAAQPRRLAESSAPAATVETAGTAAAVVVLPVAADSALAVSDLPPWPRADSGAAAAAAPRNDTVSGYFVQLGAFRLRDGADDFQRRVAGNLDWIAPALSVRSDADLHRLQAGPYGDRDQAAGVAERVRESLQLVPIIVERR